AILEKQYDKIMLKGVSSVAQLKYNSGAYPAGINISNGELLFNGNSVSLSHLNGNYMNSSFSATGVMNNLIGYMMKQGALTGDLNLSADKAKLNDWTGTPASTSASSSAGN